MRDMRQKAEEISKEKKKKKKIISSWSRLATNTKDDPCIYTDVVRNTCSTTYY